MSSPLSSSTGSPAAGADDRPVVLVVCTGNVCRSPLAERALQAALDAATPEGATGVRVVSAGTGALAGEPMTDEAADAVVRAGGDPAGHRARDLVPAQVREAALVLTATRDHRADVVRLVPAAVRRTFTLREAGRLAQARADGVTGADPAERLGSLAGVLARARGSLLAADPADDDVLDPFRRGPEAWQATEEQLVPALRALAAALSPPA